MPLRWVNNNFKPLIIWALNMLLLRAYQDHFTDFLLPLWGIVDLACVMSKSTI